MEIWENLIRFGLLQLAQKKDRISNQEQVDYTCSRPLFKQRVNSESSIF